MNVNNFSSFYIDFGAHVYGYAGSLYVHLWFLLIFSGELYMEPTETNGSMLFMNFERSFLHVSMLFMNKHEELFCWLLSTKITCSKCTELYIDINGSTLTILHTFLGSTLTMPV
jgi:hypothetical protein